MPETTLITTVDRQKHLDIYKFGWEPRVTLLCQRGPLWHSVCDTFVSKCPLWHSVGTSYVTALCQSLVPRCDDGPK